MNKNKLLSFLREASHPAELQSVAAQIKSIHPADLADVLNELNSNTILSLLKLLDPHTSSTIFIYLDEDRQEILLQEMPRELIPELFKCMPSDERADLYNRMEQNVKHKLLPILAPHERDDILRMSSFPDSSTGSEATSDFVSVSPDMTVTQALEHIRMTATDKETVYIIYVINDRSHLCGTVSLRELVLARDHQKISDIMRPNPIFARADCPKEKAAELIRHYDLLALPVIDGADKMIGIVTIDDAMDIEKEQDATQLARFGGTAVGDGPDLDILSSPLSRIFQVRVFWLALLTIFGVITSTFVASQEEVLSEVIILAAFLAPVIDMGGNTGSQSATLVIRGMALGDLTVKWKYVWLVIRRELPVVIALGITISLLELILAWFSKGIGIDVMLVVGLSMLVCTVLGGVIGVVLPFIARRIGTDPATLSSPLITSIMDLLGVFIYFGFAWFFFGDLL
ncbi:magnesium transporter [Escherichia coli]|nr:magnesium transporter [Escherichia coli]